MAQERRETQDIINALALARCSEAITAAKKQAEAAFAALVANPDAAYVTDREATMSVLREAIAALANARDRIEDDLTAATGL